MLQIVFEVIFKVIRMTRIQCTHLLLEDTVISRNTNVWPVDTVIEQKYTSRKLYGSIARR